jgi:hypothetical protein
MSARNIPDSTPIDAIKDPTEWTTGEEPMTGAQGSYLHTLARQAGEEVEDDLTKAEASMKIDELRELTGKIDVSRKSAARAKTGKNTGR